VDFFGLSIESIYLITLIVVGSITVLFILFGSGLIDVSDAGGVLNPTIILSFITIFSASGYLFEMFTLISSMLILLFSLIIALILVTILNVFILIPLSKAEESLVYSANSLKGRVGKVITPIPLDGFGEVVLTDKSGTIAKSAVSFNQEEISEGVKVLVIDVQKGVLHVTPYEQSTHYNL